MAGAVYWVGQDGHYYYGSGQAGAPVQNLGVAGNTNPNTDIINSATRIPDPAAPTSPVGVGADGANVTAGTTAMTTAPAPTNPNGATHPPLNTGAVNNTQLAIDQLPALLQAALGSEDQTYQNSQNTFNQQEQMQNSAHDAGTVTNQQNYDSNFMDSIRAGIHGLGGLMSILRGQGAGGGTADDQVRDVVGQTTAGDIRNGADTQKNNQGQLDSSLSSFLTDLKGKRQVNDDTHTNNRSAINRDSNTQLQDLYGKMAGFYGDAGDTGTANDWLGKAGALTPTIAANSRTAVGNYDTTPVVIHAPNLTAFSAPSQPNVAVAPADGQVGSGIFSLDTNKPRKDASAPAADPLALTPPTPVAAGV